MALPKKISEALSRSIERIYPSKPALQKALREGVRLKFYLGVDPTSSHLHLGHLEQMLVLRRLQELGCEIVFLIGDFTGMIGDPTDKLAARKPLGEEEVLENSKAIRSQAEKILNFKGPNPARIEFNSYWLRDMKLSNVMGLASHVTVQQLIERDMFQKRIKEKKPIHLHEFLYPLLQGYDSVSMQVDGEVGGRDQTFNMLMGRTLEKSFLNKEKFVVATKLLVNPKTGQKLMSKSQGGTINLDDSPEDVFGKTMAQDDETMFQIAEHCTEMPLAKIKSLTEKVKRNKMNPRDAKLLIAEAVTGALHGPEIAARVKQEFLETFSRGKISEHAAVLTVPKPVSLLELVSHSGVAKSKSEARRLIEQGAVEINKKRKTNPYEEIKFKGGEVLKIGKKSFFRIEKK